MWLWFLVPSRPSRSCSSHFQIASHLLGLHCSFRWWRSVTREQVNLKGSVILSLIVRLVAMTPTIEEVAMQILLLLALPCENIALLVNSLQRWGCCSVMLPDACCIDLMLRLKVSGRVYGHFYLQRFKKDFLHIYSIHPVCCKGILQCDSGIHQDSHPQMHLQPKFMKRMNELIMLNWSCFLDHEEWASHKTGGIACQLDCTVWQFFWPSNWWEMQTSCLSLITVNCSGKPESQTYFMMLQRCTGLKQAKRVGVRNLNDGFIYRYVARLYRHSSVPYNVKSSGIRQGVRTYHDREHQHKDEGASAVWDVCIVRTIENWNDQNDIESD